uniref:cytochrome P450 2C42-like isoform X1 n=1 Tax=Styela clava TaxID=7725 RepID=UPI00193A706D|nr:cytochrome P450 2C42-like isoform X1 [Styela clava]
MIELEYMIAGILLGICSLLYLFYLPMTRPKQFPPGPRGIPIVGSVHLIGQHPHISFAKLASKYGDVFSLKAFNKYFVIVNGYQAIKECHVQHGKIISGRPLKYMVRHLMGDQPTGIVNDLSCTPTWKAQRKMFNFAMKKMSANLRIDDIIMTEAECVVNELENMASADEAIDLANLLECGVLNVISGLLLGKRFDFNDPKMIYFVKLNQEFFRLATVERPTDSLPDIFPWITKFWIPKKIIKLTETIKCIIDFCAEEVEEHKNKLDPENPVDFIDYSLIKISQNSELTEEALINTVTGLFQAGNESTTATLRWGILLLSNNPEIQKKVHNEIDEIIGNKKAAKYNERSMMPYTEATMHEILRFANVAHIGLPRDAVEDFYIRGYKIPKETTFILNLYSSHMQEDKWKNASQFDPTNFIDENGDFFKPDAFVAFSGGPRMCVAISQAKHEIFLFLVAILQKFCIKPEHEGEVYDLTPRPGLSLLPKHYKFRFIKRF